MLKQVINLLFQSALAVFIGLKAIQGFFPKFSSQSSSNQLTRINHTLKMEEHNWKSQYSVIMQRIFKQKKYKGIE